MKKITEAFLILLIIFTLLYILKDDVYYAPIIYDKF
jgi:hypothetical protein